MAFKKMHSFIVGEYIIIETDNKNLLLMETSTSNFIKIWRISLQDYHTSLRHFLAHFNEVSDLLTRQYNLYLAYTQHDNSSGDYNTFTSDLYIIHDDYATDTDAFFTAVLNVLVP